MGKLHALKFCDCWCWLYVATITYDETSLL